MSDKQREQDDVQQKQDSKQQGQTSQQGGGNSGIHKYFGKSSKSLKLLTSKIKKQAKLQNGQNISLLVQTNLNSQKQLSSAHQKTKLKFQYRWFSSLLNTKPKLKLTFNPFIKNKILQEVLLNWKNVINKSAQENVDIKINDKKTLNMKYKRTRTLLDKKLKNKIQLQANVQPDLNVKSSASLQSVLKSSLFQDYKYLNSGELKGKMGLRDFSFRGLSGTFKFDFAQKLTFLINQFKAKQQTKLNMSFGAKQSIQLKTNVQVTDPTNTSNTWTLYGAAYGYKWGVAFDQVKFVYSLLDNWKVGAMYGQKNTWEFMIQNPKLNKNYCSSVALHVGNKNYALILKNRFNNKELGKVNFQLSLQNPLRNTRLDKINYGLNVNFNL